MKKLLLMLSLLVTTLSVYAQSGFQPTSSAVDTTVVGSQYDKYVSIPIHNLFTYPEGVDFTKDPASLGMTFEVTSSNPELVSFYKAQSGVKPNGAALSLKVAKVSYGDAQVQVKLTYNEQVTQNSVTIHVLPMKVTDFRRHVVLQEPSEIDALVKTAFYNTTAINEATITINNVKHGTAQVKVGDKGHQVIEYTPSTTIEGNYRDVINYTVALPYGEPQTGEIQVLAHGNIYAAKVIDFVPGPGQFTNTVTAPANPVGVLGNPNVDDATTPRTSGTISLGAFGGYMVLGFDHPVKNNPRNRYGVDFSIVGNAFSGNLRGVWSEPGAVQVMKDLNGDGIPNDGAWYELAGSDYWLESTLRNIDITYYNPGYSQSHTTVWEIPGVDAGGVLTNMFHRQAYYPEAETYGNDPHELTFHGTKILSSVDKRSPAYVEFYRSPGFGYADNHGIQTSSDPTSPTNPYYPDENGKVMDGFDISWAVNDQGQYVDLDQIDFVRIYTAGNMNGGSVGEWSTEIAGVIEAIPEDEVQTQDYYMNYIGINRLQVPLNTTARFQGLCFKNGRLTTEGTPHFRVKDPEIGTIDDNGNFTGHSLGKTIIYFQQTDKAPEDWVEVEVDQLQSLICDQTGNAKNTATTEITLYAGDKEYINIEGIDNVTEKVNNKFSNRYIYDTYTWQSSNSTVGTVNATGVFTALAAGETVVTATSVLDPTLSTTVKMIVKDFEAPALLSDEITLTYETDKNKVLSVGDLFKATADKSIIFLQDVQGGDDQITLQGNKLQCNFTSAGRYPLTLSVLNHGKTYQFHPTLLYLDPETGLNEVSTDNQPMEYYNLQGVRILNPGHGIFVVKQGKKISKIMR